MWYSLHIQINQEREAGWSPRGLEFCAYFVTAEDWGQN